MTDRMNTAEVLVGHVQGSVIKDTAASVLAAVTPEQPHRRKTLATSWKALWRAWPIKGLKPPADSHQNKLGSRFSSPS